MRYLKKIIFYQTDFELGLLRKIRIQVQKFDFEFIS